MHFVVDHPPLGLFCLKVYISKLNFVALLPKEQFFRSDCIFFVQKNCNIQCGSKGSNVMSKIDYKDFSFKTKN